MHRPDAGAGEHGDGGFGHHRQVDRDPVALRHALRLQQVGEAADFTVQVAIGQAARGGGGVVRLPQDRYPVAMFGKVPVHGVGADIELAALEPADAKIVLVE